MEAAGFQPGSDTLEEIVDAGTVLVVLRTEQAGLLVDQFRSVARRSGQAVYVWHPDQGLKSLREVEVRVPGCRRVGDTLRYVLQSMHFGIYLMTGVRGKFSAADHLLLRKLSRTPSEQVRRVVFLTDDDAVIQSLEDMATLLGGQAAGSRPRLRDGRWVV